MTTYDYIFMIDESFKVAMNYSDWTGYQKAAIIHSASIPYINPTAGLPGERCPVSTLAAQNV